MGCDMMGYIPSKTNVTYTICDSLVVSPVDPSGNRLPAYRVFYECPVEEQP